MYSYVYSARVSESEFENDLSSGASSLCSDSRIAPLSEWILGAADSKVKRLKRAACVILNAGGES